MIRSRLYTPPKWRINEKKNRKKKKRDRMNDEVLVGVCMLIRVVCGKVFVLC